MKNFNKTFLLLLNFNLCLLPSSFSQNVPGIAWQNTIGGSDWDEVRAVQQTADGGYVFGGLSRSNISGDKTENCIGFFDYWIVKTDASGNILWQNTIGGSMDDWLNSIRQTSDGGYILGGTSVSNISGDKAENSLGSFDYWVVKTDASGNILWQNTIGGSSDDRVYDIRQTADGGYIVGGRSNSGISGDKTEDCASNNIYHDYWILKLDTGGNIQWQNTIGGDNYDFLYSVQQTTDGGYILGGNSRSDISGDKTENCMGGISYDYWIVKTDASGTIQWQNTIGGTVNDELFSIQQTDDSGYILGGISSSNISGDKTENSNGLNDYWIVKTDSEGNIQWQNTIGGDSSDYCRSIQQTVDGGYIVGGYSKSNISGDKTEGTMGGYDYWIVKIDASGIIQWQNTIGGDTTDYLYYLHATTDNGYILCGYSQSDISDDKTENCLGSWDYWIVKLYPDPATGNNVLPNQTSHIRAFPNPFTDELLLRCSESAGKAEIKIYDVWGTIVFAQQIPGKPGTGLTSNFPMKSEQVKLQTSHWQKGIYFIEVISNGIAKVGKVIKQ